MTLLAMIAIAVVAVDQLTKALAVDRLSDRGPVELGPLTLRLVYNPGAAFGLASGFTIVLTLLAMVVVVVILRFARRLTSLPWAVALGLLLAGAVGNLIDRVFRAPAPLKGHVVDFLDLPFTLVFNVADMAITFAGVLMVVLTFRGIQPDGAHPVDDSDGLPADE